MRNGDIQGIEGPGGSPAAAGRGGASRRIAAVVAEIQAKMREYGITLADLRGGAKKSRSRAAVAAKYRNPATGESWSGRGRAPKWLADEMAKGRARDEFLVG